MKQACIHSRVTKVLVRLLMLPVHHDQRRSKEEVTACTSCLTKNKATEYLHMDVHGSPYPRSMIKTLYRFYSFKFTPPPPPSAPLLCARTRLQPQSESQLADMHPVLRVCNGNKVADAGSFPYRPYKGWRPFLLRRRFLAAVERLTAVFPSAIQTLKAHLLNALGGNRCIASQRAVILDVRVLHAHLSSGA